MASITDYNKAKAQFNPLCTRWDFDLGLYYLERYVMMDENKQPIENVDNVTLNDPRTYADRVIAGLHAANLRPEITGIPELEQEKLEKEFQVVLDNNDDYLSNQILEPLNFCESFYTTVRGWASARIMTYKYKDKIFTEVMPIDPRSKRWFVDANGTVWSGYEYPMEISEAIARFSIDKAQRQELKAAYSTESSTNETSGSTVPVLELFDRKNYMVYVGNQRMFGLAHGCDFCPDITIPVPTQPFLIEPQNTHATVSVTNPLMRRGESCYAANRDLYAAANDLASVWATMSKSQFMTPIAFTSESGRKLKRKPYGIGVVINLKKGEQFAAMPTKEMSASAQMLFAQYMSRIQRGGLPFTDFGELSFELSAVAIAKLGETRDQIFVPRLTCMSSFYKRLLQMIKLQQQGCYYETKIPESATGFVMDKKLISKQFAIKVQFSSISPEQNIANIQVAQSAERWISDETIVKDYMRVQDWKSELRRKKLNNAERAVPNLALFNYALELAPIKGISEDVLNSKRADIIWNELEQATQGAIQKPGAVARTPSQPKIDLGARMPPMMAKSQYESGKSKRQMPTGSQKEKSQNIQTEVGQDE